MVLYTRKTERLPPKWSRKRDNGTITSCLEKNVINKTISDKFRRDVARCLSSSIDN